MKDAAPGSTPRDSPAIVLSVDRDLEEFLASRQAKRVQRERFTFGHPEGYYDAETERLREQIKVGQVLDRIERTTP